MNAYKKAITDVLVTKDQPVHVETVRIAVGIGNWNTCLRHLLELFIDGKIRGVKTTRGWIFWLDKEAEH